MLWLGQKHRVKSESFQKTQLKYKDAASDSYMGKRGATALPLATPPSASCKSLLGIISNWANSHHWALFLEEGRYKLWSMIVSAGWHILLHAQGKGYNSTDYKIHVLPKSWKRFSQGGPREKSSIGKRSKTFSLKVWGVSTASPANWVLWTCLAARKLVSSSSSSPILQGSWESDAGQLQARRELVQKSWSCETSALPF